MIKSGKKETVWGYLTFIISSGAMYLLWRNFTVGFSAGAGAIDGITGSAIGELFIKVIIGGVTYLAIIGAIFAAVKGVIVLKENINYRNTRGGYEQVAFSIPSVTFVGHANVCYGL